jgi:hypothetical protein
MAKMLGDAIHWLSALERDQAQVVANLRDWSGGLSSGGGPQPKNAVSDPTGNAAMAVDSWGLMRAELGDLILAVYRKAKDAEKIRREVVEPPPEKEPADRGLAECCNPNCPDEAWAVKAGRCERCYAYKWKYDRDRRMSKLPEEG